MGTQPPPPNYSNLPHQSHHPSHSNVNLNFHVPVIPPYGQQAATPPPLPPPPPPPPPPSFAGIQSNQPIQSHLFQQQHQHQIYQSHHAHFHNQSFDFSQQPQLHSHSVYQVPPPPLPPPPPPPPPSSSLPADPVHNQNQQNPHTVKLHQPFLGPGQNVTHNQQYSFPAVHLDQRQHFQPTLAQINPGPQKFPKGNGTHASQPNTHIEDKTLLIPPGILASYIMEMKKKATEKQQNAIPGSHESADLKSNDKEPKRDTQENFAMPYALINPDLILELTPKYLEDLQPSAMFQGEKDTMDKDVTTAFDAEQDSDDSREETATKRPRKEQNKNQDKVLSKFEEHEMLKKRVEELYAQL